MFYSQFPQSLKSFVNFSAVFLWLLGSSGCQAPNTEGSPSIVHTQASQNEIPMADSAPIANEITEPNLTQKNPIITREKYSHQWYLYCRKSPEEAECILDNFKENPDSFTTIMGLQDEAKPGNLNPNNQITRYDKFVPAQHISIRRLGDFPDSQHCTNLEDAIKDHTDNLIHVAHSGFHGSRLHIDYHFLTYLDYDKLSRILQDNFDHEPIGWEAIPTSDIASHEFDITYPISTQNRFSEKRMNKQRADVTPPKAESKSRMVYEKFDFFDVPNTAYRLYDFRTKELRDSVFQNTEFNAYRLYEFHDYFSATPLFHVNSSIETYFPNIRLLDFIENQDLYFLGHISKLGSRAPDILDRIDLYKLVLSRPPAEAQSLSPYCSIEFIFEPNQ